MWSSVKIDLPSSMFIRIQVEWHIINVEHIWEDALRGRRGEYGDYEYICRAQNKGNEGVNRQGTFPCIVAKSNVPVSWLLILFWNGWVVHNAATIWIQVLSLRLTTSLKSPQTSNLLLRPTTYTLPLFTPSFLWTSWIHFNPLFCHFLLPSKRETQSFSI